MPTTQPGKNEVLDNLPPSSRRRKKRVLLLFVLPLIVIAASLFFYFQGGRYAETDNAYVKADKTNISAEVAGRIIDVPVKENQQVKLGQLLLKLDPKPYEIALEKARANLNDVRTELLTLKAEYQSKQADIQVAESQYQYLQREENRQRNLLKQKFISDSQFDTARQNTLTKALTIKALHKNLEQIASSLGGYVSLPVEQHPKYLSALVALDKAQNDLQHVNVYAPADGVVTKVVEKGQYVAPGTIAMLLVEDAHLWIEANFTEKELTYVRVGQESEITVDYAPGYTWKGHVISLSPATGAEFSVIPAQNATGNWVKITQRVPVRISIESQPDAPELRAGLSAVVSVDTRHHRSLAL